MEIGPKTYIRQDNEKVILGPEKMIVVPPRHYCIVENPVVVKDEAVVVDSYGQVRVWEGQGDTEGWKGASWNVRGRVDPGRC